MHSQEQAIWSFNRGAPRAAGATAGSDPIDSKRAVRTLPRVSRGSSPHTVYSHISYNWWVLVVHIWILYYLLSSLIVVSDLTVRTFAHYVWVLVAATMLLFVAARWFPDLEIALIRHVVVPLQGLLWVLFWTVRRAPPPVRFEYLKPRLRPFLAPRQMTCMHRAATFSFPLRNWGHLHLLYIH